jgi:hypothetical protein
MFVSVDASGSAEQVNLGSASGQPEETQQHNCPPSSSRVPNYVESQPSTQTTANETNLSLPSGPHLEVDQPVELAVLQTRGSQNGRKGLKGRNASLLTFNKKKGALEILKRTCAVTDSQTVEGAKEVPELLESTRATLGSMAFHSGPSIETSSQDRDASATVAAQTSHDDAESRLLADYEEQNQPCLPPSPNVE